MKDNFQVEEIVRKRYSVRTYDNRSLGKTAKEKLLTFAAQLDNPLGPKIRMQFIDKDMAMNGGKLGTYGIIKGAKTFLAVTVPNETYAPEALGYEFERVVLYATSLGLGTCWLGGTFNRSGFASEIEIKKDEVFPILSPIGVPAQKRRIGEKLFRQTIKADGRMDWSELFFRNDFEKTLSKEDAGIYEFPLEMVRLAPSAANKQPWRIVVTDQGVHFFEKSTLGGEGNGMDMQRIDIGIGICHFHLAAMEKNMQGHFERNCPEIQIPKGMTYIASWMKD